MTTKRTNEPKPIVITLRSECSKRLASMFLFKDRYRLKEIYTVLNNAINTPQFSKSAIRGTLTRWRKKRLLLTDGYFYILNPSGGRDALIYALGPDDETVREQEALVQLTSDPNVRTERIILEMTKRRWNEVFDLPKAWEEGNKIYCRIDEHIAKKMWAVCERKPKGKKDRTRKASHRQKTFTLVAFPNGRFHVFTKNDPGWLDDLGMWLANGGMSESDLLLVSQAVHYEFGESIGTVEVPLKRKLDMVREFKLDIEVGETKASLKLVHSHYAEEGEMEATGNRRFRDEWLASLAGSTIANMGRMEEVKELKGGIVDLRTKFESLSSKIEQTERDELKQRMEELSSKIERLEVEQDTERREPEYYI